MDLVLFYGLPWSWLVLAVEPVADGEGVPASMPISRAALGLATPLVVLLAYPVAGSQISFAMLPLLVGCGLRGRHLAVVEQAKLAATAGCSRVRALALAFLSVNAYRSVKNYRWNEPLGLPGASRPPTAGRGRRNLPLARRAAPRRMRHLRRPARPQQLLFLGPRSPLRPR